MRLASIAVTSGLLGVLLPSCSGTESDNGPAGTLGLGTIGQACDSLRPCAAELFCYEGDNALLEGLCTKQCTASADSDSCLESHPNTKCLVAGVCGASCGSALGCPTGAACNPAYQVCVNIKNSCATAIDSYCDEPDQCEPGTDSFDCGGARAQ